jgi:nicotinamide-nucleotide amidase
MPIPVRSAELLAVGTELLLGEIIDTNSAWLAQQLADRSVDVYWSQRVGDNRERIARAIDSALARSDLVLLCGGLGPTDDDLTREAIADVLGELPSIDPDLEVVLRARFARYGGEMPERNLKQAWRIPSAIALANPVGTAPGWFVQVPEGRYGAGRTPVIAAIPGPPHEMRPMWLEQVRPRLAFPTAKFIARTLKTFGIGESHVAERLGQLTTLANPSVATYAKRDGVHVRIAAKGESEGEALSLLEPTYLQVRALLGDAVWGGEGDELADRALATLAARGGRLSFIDLASGGRLATALHEVTHPDRDRYFRDGMPATELRAGGVVGWEDDALDVLDARATSSLAAATSPLRVYQPDDAVALAQAACARFATDYSVGLTPWRKVTTDGTERPSWTACWAVIGPQGVDSRCVTYPPQGAGARDERLVHAALFALWSLTTR